MAGDRLEFRALGSLEVVDSGISLPLGPPKQRGLLAVLLLRAGEPVSADVLIDALWSDDPPASAATSLQGYVSQLRKLLGPDVIHTEGGGYRLDVAADAVDTSRFERLISQGTAALDAGRCEIAADTLRK